MAQAYRMEMPVIKFDDRENTRKKLLKPALPCEYCEKTFQSKAQLDKHQDGHFNEPKAAQAYRIEDRPADVKEEAPFKGHNVHVNVSDTVEENTRTEQSKQGVSPCEVCGRVFKTNYRLKKHYISHTDARPYMCTECGKMFKQSGHLAHHLLKHTGIKPYPCSVCGSSFHRNSELERHFKTHTGEKPFSCNICEKSFVQKSNLLCHIKAHNGDRQHQCGVCEKRFMTNSKLNTHMKKHDRNKKSNFIKVENE